ncbi:MAG: Rab5 GDP/GTP exchange factor, partial [Paramarteilia canceri]
CNPKKLLSNIEFIKLYSSEKQLSLGEEAYYFASFEASVTFIEKINHTVLKMDKEEFESLCDKQRKEFESNKLGILKRIHDVEDKQNKSFLRIESLEKKLSNSNFLLEE